MKTGKLRLSSRELGMTEALALTERIGSEAGLERKQVLHLRLLAEEFFGMLRGIAGEVEADYWLSAEGRHFELHMRSQVDLTDEMRRQLLAASSSGENAAARGVMGKLRVMIAETLFSKSAKQDLGLGLSLGMMDMASATGNSADSGQYLWTLNQYRDEVERLSKEDRRATEAWDELEKSIVANVADDVRVSILGSAVEIAVYKTF